MEQIWNRFSTVCKIRSLKRFEWLECFEASLRQRTRHRSINRNRREHHKRSSNLLFLSRFWILAGLRVTFHYKVTPSSPAWFESTRTVRSVVIMFSVPQKLQSKVNINEFNIPSLEKFSVIFEKTDDISKIIPPI